MGVSTDAHLFYGVEIHSEDDGWLTNEPTREWWTRRNETGDILEFPDEYDQDGYTVAQAYDNVEDQPELKGIGIAWHCHINEPVWVLNICQIRAWRGGPQHLNLRVLEEQRIEEQWDQRLAAALKWLGIVPSVKPGWIIASSSDH